jgi:hypothetical protein
MMTYSSGALMKMTNSATRADDDDNDDDDDDDDDDDPHYRLTDEDYASTGMA